MPEMWDVYDINRKPLGKLHDRAKYSEDPLLEGEYHIVVNIVSVNSDGKILVTKRHPDKTFGGLWEITGGSIVAGENSADGAERELFEETGLSAERSLEYRGTIVRPQTNSIHDFYLFRGAFGEGDIRLQEGETTDFRLVTAGELCGMAQVGELIGFVYDRIKAVFPDILEDEKA